MFEEHAGKNFPRPSAETLPYWEGCRAGELRLQRCARCGAHQFYPRMLCSACGGTELAWVRASGRGSIRSYSVVRRPVSKAYAADTPYVVALIRLEEGPTMMSNVIGCDPASVVVGAAVEVVFESWSAEITVPKFRLPSSS
jgi:uncharacterized OB-fold protein